MIGVLFGLLSAFSWSAANYFIQPAAKRFGDLAALMQAQVCGAVVVIPFALWVEGSPPTSITDQGLAALLIASVAAMVAYVGLFCALARGRLAIVAPLISSWTVLSVIIGIFWLGEQMTALQWTGVGLVIAGNVLLARQRADDAESDLTRPRGRFSAGVGWALLSALGFGFMVPAVDVLGLEAGRLWAIPAVWSCELAMGLAIWAVGAWYTPIRAAFGPQSLAKDLPQVTEAGRVGLLEVIGFVGLSLGVGMAPVSIVAPMASLSTGLSVLWGVHLRQEPLSRGALAGAMMASLGVVLVSIPTLV